jgi:hypothetical protein
MVHANGTMYVYQNGVLANAIAAGAQDGGNINFPFVIGENNWKNLTFNGAIDDVRIYSRALSASEVQALYHLGAANVAHSNTTALSSGLVGYWTFDGGTTHWNTGNVDDVSGHGNTGQLINMSTTTSPVPGKIGQALKFNGSSSYVNLGNATSLGTGNFTMAAWIKASQARSDWRDIITKWPNAYAFQIDKGGGGFCPSGGMSVAGALIMNEANAVVVCGGSVVDDGKWHHVAYTRNGSTRVFYVDGAAITSISNTNTIPSLTAALNDNIGQLTGGGQQFTGTIDDVRIYNRALSSSEVQALYRMGRVRL